MKILFNSYPLSGHIQLCGTIMRLTRKMTEDNPEQMAEMPNWTIWKQEPIFFTGLYEGVKLCSVIRDPLEVISLNVDRWFGGHSEKRVFNKEAIDESMKRTNTKLSREDIDFIEHQVRIYKSYINCFEQRKQPIYLTTYNDYINKSKEVVSSVLEFAGLDFNDFDFNQTSVTRDIEQSETELYDQIKDVVINYKDFDFVKTWYLDHA